LSVLSTADKGLSKGQLDAATEQTLRRIAASAEKLGNLKEYVKGLFSRFDRNNDGFISFDELCQGLSQKSIYLSQQEKKALMGRLDVNGDGRIKAKEVEQALEPYVSENRRGVDKNHSAQIQTAIQNALIKIVGGAEDPTKLREYSKTLIRRFDIDSDGVISYRELVEGLKDMHIFLNPAEREGLMKKLDVN
jgi:Ca2+-binding EF-hand superfamily protein